MAINVEQAIKIIDALASRDYKVKHDRHTLLKRKEC